LIECADHHKVIEEPQAILNSLIYSVLLESEKAKKFAELKMKQSLEQVLAQ
jgi:hypothetical protein